MTLACVEVGGSGSQTVLFRRDGHSIYDGARQPRGAELAIAVPGLIEGPRVLAASNLGWTDVDPVEQLGLRGPAAVVCNDAEAAALGESALRDDLPDLVFVGLGTGVGGAVIENGHVVGSNLFGHDTGFSERSCPCGRVGCLETVAAGWALPDELGHDALLPIASAVARAVLNEAVATPRLLVVAGGIARRYPRLVTYLDNLLEGWTVEPSAAPHKAKSASAWGLQHLVDRLSDPVG